MALGWFVGVIALSLRLLGGCVQAERLKRRNVQPLGAVWEKRLERLAEQLNISKAVTLLESSLVATPVLIGWLRPVILFPVATLVGLPNEQLEAVLAHELAHVKRSDYLVHLMQCAIEVALFYHPAVWWVSRQVSIEREHACDDLAAAACGDKLCYAHALTGLAQLAQAGPQVALAANGGSLFTRIRRLVTPPSSETTGNAAWLPGGMIATAAALAVLMTLHIPATAAVHLETQAPASESGRVQIAQVPSPTALVAPAVSTVSAPAKPAESATLGVALIDFSRLGTDASLGEISSQLYELVSERLSASAQVRLVERGQLEKALTELKLNQTGLVDSGTATQVGQVVGARIFISGKLMKAVDDWVCTVKLIDTQTSEISALRVTAKPNEGALRLADAIADAVLKRLDGLSLGKGAAADAAQTAIVDALRAQLANRTLPTVAVSIPEHHIGTWVPDPAGENELISTLTRAGYRVVDISTLMNKESSSWWARLFHGPAAAPQGGQGQGTETQLTAGFQSPSEIMKNKEIEKVKQNVDLFVIGEAFSEAAGENYGFKSCTARVEIKVIDTKTEAVACATSQHSSAADLSEHTAGKKALRQSGGELGIKLAKEMADYWDKRMPAGATPAVAKP